MAGSRSMCPVFAGSGTGVSVRLGPDPRGEGTDVGFSNVTWAGRCGAVVPVVTKGSRSRPDGFAALYMVDERMRESSGRTR